MDVTMGLSSRLVDYTNYKENLWKKVYADVYVYKDMHVMRALMHLHAHADTHTNTHQRLTQQP